MIFLVISAAAEVFGTPVKLENVDNGANETSEANYDSVDDFWEHD